jgi:predicted RNA-binding protein with RPS1 domain
MDSTPRLIVNYGNFVIIYNEVVGLLHNSSNKLH